MDWINGKWQGQGLGPRVADALDVMVEEVASILRDCTPEQKQAVYDRFPSPPIDMVLHCPACGEQHIDAPELHHVDAALERNGLPGAPDASWTNPPHRSHLCAGCGHIWRPADVPTNGVEAVKTRGKEDSPVVAGRTEPGTSTVFYTLPTEGQPR